MKLHRSQFGLLCFVLSLPALKLVAADEKTEELPALTVQGSVTGTEEELVGDYAQPAWTTSRRFSTTRVYIAKNPWEMEFEQWWRGRFYRNGDAKNLFQEELEIGLPYRAQLDLYNNWMRDPDGHIHQDSIALEGRWALADWGKIPLNPTLYFEWKFTDQAPDVFETKLLLGDNLGKGWHWGLNFAWEQEVGGSRTTELAVSQGLSYTVMDSVLDCGVEMVYKNETVAGARSDAEVSVLLGPSVQWHPFERVSVDLVPLFGLTNDAPRIESYVIVSIDLFDLGKHETHGRNPASTRGN